MTLDYYKLEQRDNFDMKKTRTVYKLKAKQHYGGKRFIQMVAHRHGFSETIIEGVLLDVANELELLLGEGATVTLPGIGSFSLGIRLSEERKQQLEDEQYAAETASEEAPKVVEPNATHLELHHVNFRLDKELFQGIRSRFRQQKLQRIYGKEGSRITIDNMTQQARIEAAHRFLEENAFMHVSDYAAITGLSYSSAQRELKELVDFEPAGIICRGRGSHKVWMRKP